MVRGGDPGPVEETNTGVKSSNPLIYRNRHGDTRTRDYPIAVQWHGLGAPKSARTKFGLSEYMVIWALDIGLPTLHVSTSH